MLAAGDHSVIEAVPGWQLARILLFRVLGGGGGGGGIADGL